MAYIREDRSELLHYDIPDFPVFFRKNHIPANCIFNDTSVHWHDEVEFIYVVSGSIGYLVNGKTLRIPQGHGLFVNSRQLHLILQDNQDCVLYCLIFHPSILCSSAVIAKSVSDIVSGDTPYIELDCADDDCRCTLEHIASIDGLSSDTAGQLETMRALYGIWHGLYRKANVSCGGDHLASSDLVVIRQIMLFVQEHCSEDITLDELCRAGNVGKTKCSELFKKYLNTTPMGYVRDFRIEKSIKLMESGMTISEAAHSTGFSELSHFSKVFKSKMLTNPKEYMERRRRESQ